MNRSFSRLLKSWSSTPTSTTRSASSWTSTSTGVQVSIFVINSKPKGFRSRSFSITGNATPSTRGRTAIWMRRISNQAFLNPRTDRAAQESVGRVKLSARVPGPCTLYFGTMHHRTTFAKLISEFGLSGTSPPNQYRYTAPRGPSFPKDWGHTFPRSRRWFLLFHSHIGR